MASAPHHTRSNSLPSRPNLLVSQFDEQLSRLRSSESPSSSSSSSSINSKLSHLSDLYDCIDEFLQLPSSIKALTSQVKLAEDSLEGSIKLLDICSTITDVLMRMKECGQELQSILRRRCSKDEIDMEVAKYLKSRKTAIKAVSKALKELKKVECKYAMEITGVISKLRECQKVTLTMLESVLVSIAGPKAESAVSKLFKSKRITSQQDTEFFLFGFETTDASLHPEKLRSCLESMEISIKDVEHGIEILFRHLIKTRTTILNILN